MLNNKDRCFVYSDEICLFNFIYTQYTYTFGCWLSFFLVCEFVFSNFTFAHFDWFGSNKCCIKKMMYDYVYVVSNWKHLYIPRSFACVKSCTREPPSTRKPIYVCVPKYTCMHVFECRTHLNSYESTWSKLQSMKTKWRHPRNAVSIFCTWMKTESFACRFAVLKIWCVKTTSFILGFLFLNLQSKLSLAMAWQLVDFPLHPHQ